MSEGGRRDGPAGGRGLQQRDGGIEEKKGGMKGPRDARCKTVNNSFFMCGGVRRARVRASGE